MIDPRESARTAERLRLLVEAESPTGDRERIRAALDLVEEWASAALGRRGRTVTIDGVDHLLWEATASPSVLLLGHVDTVWPAGTLAERPFSLEDGRVRGPGIFDMKAGLVAAIGAIERVADPARVALLVTSDEETGSRTSRALIEQSARPARAVLVTEPSFDGALKTSRCGAGLYRIAFEGREAHAGLEPQNGANALVELAHHVLAVGALADAGVGTTVTPTVAHAGTSVNTVPGQAELRLDVRAWSLAELERVDGHLAGAAAVDPRVTLTVDGGVNRPPLEAEQSRELFRIAQAVAASRGLGELREVAAGGASDGNFTAAVGVPTLDGLGPLGGGAHARSEWASLASVVERSLLIAGIVDEITTT